METENKDSVNPKLLIALKNLDDELYDKMNKGSQNNDILVTRPVYNKHTFFKYVPHKFFKRNYMTKLCIVFILVSVFVHYKITGFHTKATQIPIFYFLIQAHDNHIRLRVNLNSANTAPTNDKANQLLEPSWLPDGYKAVNKQYTNNIYYITYIKNNHTTLEYEQTPNVTFTDADLSKSECNKYVHKGTSYYIYQKDKTIALLWFDQEYQYFLTGKESPQDMLKISYSTK